MTDLGIVSGQNLSILTELQPFIVYVKMLFGLLYLFCIEYVDELSHIYRTLKVTYHTQVTLMLVILDQKLPDISEIYFFSVQ